MVPKLLQHAYQNSVKCWLASLLAAHLFMTFDLAFVLQGQIQGQRAGYQMLSKNMSACIPKLSQTTASFPGQLTILWTLTWYLTCWVKLKVKGQGTGYRPKITSARVPKWFQATASLSWQRTQQWTLTWQLMFKVKFTTECQAKGYGYVICPGKLAAVCDHFGRRADAVCWYSET